MDFILIKKQSMNQIVDWIKKRKVLSILICIIFFLIFTNPSQTAFKNYLGYTSYDGLKKEKNFFMFSIYRDNSIQKVIIYNEEYHNNMDNKYLGIAGNFFQFHRPKIESVDSVIDHQEAVDSVVAPTHSQE